MIFLILLAIIVLACFYKPKFKVGDFEFDFTDIASLFYTLFFIVVVFYILFLGE